MPSDSLTQVLNHKIIPVVAIQDAKDALPLADALKKGGLPCAEITFRTAAAPDAIKAIAQRGDMLVGAGTVLTVDQVKQAMDARVQSQGCRILCSERYPRNAGSQQSHGYRNGP